MKRKIFTTLLALAMVFISALPALNPSLEVYAASKSGIKNNGTYGITININAAPFTTFANQHPKTDPYGQGGCGWYASSRAKQFNSKVSTVWNGQGWWNNRNALGYGSGGKGGIREHAIICYKAQSDGWAHVAIVEKISGNKVIISEGGNWIESDAAHGYCIIKETTVNNIENGTGYGTFQGYVYTQKAATKTFTVTFNANGGKGTMANINVVYGVGADISKCSFTKDYYKFAGWNVYVHSSKKWVYTNGSKDGAYEKGKQPSGYYLKVYKSKVVAPVSVVDKDTVELFAIWEPGKTFTVKFNANGGKGTMANINVIYGVGADVSNCNFKKDYYKFAGWNAYVYSSKKWVYTNGSQSVQAEKGKQPAGYYLKVYKTKVTYVSDVNKDTVELFAVWEPEKTFTVRFNANGGDGTMANKTVVYGVGADVSKCNFTRAAYTFVGWNAYVHSSKKWVYTNGSQSIQAEEGKQPEGYDLKVYKTRVTYVSDVDKDIVELYAVWEFTDPITPHPPYVKGETGYTSQGTFVVTSDTANTVAFTKAKNKSSVTVPDTVTLDDEKTYKVTQINAKAFTGSKIRTVTIGKNVKTIKKNAFYKSKATKLIVKTKYLTKKSVKGCLKGSKVKTVQIKIGSKKTNKAYVKKYKKIFTKANAGKKVTVK